MKKLSIIIPCYNEEKTINTVLKELKQLKLPLKKEIIVINDGSKDSSKSVIENFIQKNSKLDIRLFNKQNGGKGSAIKLGIKQATGDIFICQDADLELNINDISRCIKPIMDGKTNVVYGSRFLKNKTGVSHFWRGAVITLATNILFFKNLTDEATCYKTIKMSLLKKIPLKSNGFEWEPELTAKLFRINEKIMEIPINYYPRTSKDGKHINWIDGLIAILTLLIWRFKSFKFKKMS